MRKYKNPDFFNLRLNRRLEVNGQEDITKGNNENNEISVQNPHLSRKQHANIGLMNAQCVFLSVCTCKKILCIYFFSFFFFICSEFCHTLKWNSHGFTCVPHPDPPSQLPLHPLPLGLPSAPGPSACLMHPTWAGDLFHPR